MRKMDFAAAEKLATEIVTDARPPLRALYLSVAGPTHPDGQKVQAILQSLEELAIFPWLAAAEQRLNGDRIDALKAAADATVAYQARVVKTLREMLQRREVLPPPAVRGAMEVKPPVTRECDEAFLLLRSLHLPDQPDADRQESDSQFRLLRDADRDKQIHRYLEKGIFA